jgi:hypothetical protein
MSIQYRLNIHRLIRDLGGPSALARSTGHPRTSFYRWLKSEVVTSRVLEDVKTAFPDIDLNFYFEPIEVRSAVAHSCVDKGMAPRTIERPLSRAEQNHIKSYHEE